MDRNTRTDGGELGFTVVRALVAGYLVYLGASVIYDSLKGGSSLSPLLAWAVGLAFTASGAVYALWLWRRWRRDAAQAERSEE